MKSSIIFVMIIFLFTFSDVNYAQLLNNSFENWIDSEPQYWSTSNFKGIIFNVTQSSDSYVGSSSAKLEIVNYMNTAYPVYLISADDTNLVGQPISLKYNTFKGYYKCDLKNGVVFVSRIYMYDNDGNFIGAGEDTMDSSSSDWNLFEIPINYFYDLMPVYCNIYFAISDTSGNNDINTVGSFVNIDNLSLDIITNVKSHEKISSKFSLSQNYPNPFNPSTLISYSIPINGYLTLTVYDILGHEISKLVNQYKSAGNYEYKLDASKLSSGIYFYTLRCSKYTATKKMLLLK